MRPSTGYNSGMDEPEPCRRQISRPAIGFCLGVGCWIVAFAALLFAFPTLLTVSPSAESTPWSIAVNLPGLPFVWVFAQLCPPPFGEAEVTSWDYTAVVIGAIGSAVGWGALGALIGGLTMRWPGSGKKNAV
jgi:hypothetical protein